MMRPSARYAVAWRPSTDTERSMMRLIADFVMTTSLSAAYSQIGWPLRTTLAARSIRSSMVIRPARYASSAGSISSSVVAVRNPSPPRFTPRSGTPRSPTALAIERRVPSPPRTISRSTWDRSPMLGGLANDAALGDVLATDLELRLHERDDLAARGEHAEHCGQDFLERDEGHVDDRQRRLIAEDPRIERASVRVLHHDDSLILAQARVELARADVDRVDPCGAALEQTISESARGRADVHADAPGDLDREGAQGVHELLAAAAHERAARSDLDLGPRRYQDARLIH